MRYGSVCSGIEAATVAWHPLGWEPAWFAEIDSFPSRVLAHHYPQVPNHGDFTRIGADAGPIDLLVGGTPCQAFSVAGLRGGLNDERGNLALEYCRLADRLRPRWLVWENVPGVLSVDGGRAFGSILGAMAHLGYGIAYRVLDAQHFGVPQRRRRVFVVGYFGDWRRAGAVLFEPSSLRGNPAPRHKPRAEVAGSLTRGLGSGGPDAAHALAGHIVSVGGTVAHTLRGEGFDASEDGTGRGTPIVAAPIPFDTTQITSKINRCRPEAGDTGHPLAAQGHPPAIAFHLTQTPIGGRDAPAMGTGSRSGQASIGVAYGRNNTSGPIETAGALAAHGGPHGRLDFASETFILQHAVRRLTPRECERLQGFPDGYTAIPGAADGPRYKALGNSMAVPVMRWVGERIQRVEALCPRE